jgi:hypothetical protein
LAGIVQAFLLSAWFFLPQQLNYGLIPFVALLGYRALARYFSLSGKAFR